MGMEQLDHAALLAEWEAKRAALDAAIASLRSALAMGVFGPVGDMPSGNGFASTLVPSVSGGEVPAGAFLGKSIPDAAKLYLAIVKQKKTSKEIADALKRGGMESSSKNFYGNVHSILDRARKAGTYGIVKLDRSYWGLTDWYPAGLRSTVMIEKRGVGKKKGSRKKKGRWLKEIKAAADTTPVSSAPQHAQPTGFERMTQLLRSKPNEWFSALEVGKELGYRSNLASMMLGKLISSGKVEKNPDNGTYRIARAKLAAAGD